jgi:hypothetical protein
MRIVMKTHLFVIGATAVFGASLLTTSFASNAPDYLHFTRHRDSAGNLLMGPTQHQSEPSVKQKTMMPSQPKTFERRSTDWGMSAQEVKANEPIQPSWELRSPILPDYEQRVAYHTKIEGIEAALTYSFYENHLGQAKYVFEPQHDDAVKYVQNFHDVKTWINQSYGPPTSVQEIWLDTLYQYDQTLWGQAVLRGHLVMVAEWQKPGTDIVLVLDGGDDTVGLVADFTSTTVVVPVSFDTQSQEGNVEAVMEETMIESALPTEPTADAMIEEASVQDMSHENELSGASQVETEVVSQTPQNEINELAEIEEMLNEAYPLNEPITPAMEGGSVDSGMNEAVLEAAPDTQSSVKSEEIGHEIMDKHPMGEQHLVNEDMSQDHPLEPSVDVQALENTMDTSEAMQLEPSMEEEATEVHPTDEHADGHVIDEHANVHAMETEEPLDPQRL